MTPKAFKQAYGPWALIAGGSDGIGAAFAHQLAEKGLNLVLVARNRKRLETLKDSLQTGFSISVRTISLDLSRPDSHKILDKQTKNLDIGLLVYNATFPNIGKFLDHSLEEHQSLLAVNCRAPVGLVHAFGTRMRKRKQSGIILMSSLTAFCGTPWISHYGASKAYTLVLGEGLAHEFKKDGIDVLVCCPGATRTGNYLASLPKDKPVKGVPVMEPKAVAVSALKALGRTNVVIPGAVNKFVAFLMQRILGRRLAVSLMSDTTRKIYG
jgi:short-subunit dehydrogenase